MEQILLGNRILADMLIKRILQVLVIAYAYPKRLTDLKNSCKIPLNFSSKSDDIVYDQG